MSAYASDLIVRFRSKGVLVDTNLLLLLLIGSYDCELVGGSGFKRVAKYSIEDFTALVRLLAQFKLTVTTPHILTEVSNLAAQLPEHHKSLCFGRFVETFKDFAELNTQSFVAAGRPEFPYLGLTDCVIAQVASDYLVITDDLRFSNCLNQTGVETLNFNHVRTLAW
jgi:hypothetical protein